MSRRGTNRCTRDVSKASLFSNSPSFTANESVMNSFWIKPDGTKLYILGTNSETIYQYSLSTPRDVTTATYDSISQSIAATISSVNTMTFTDDGTKLYVIDGDVYYFTLGTPWDITTISFVNQEPFTTRGANARGGRISPDGTNFYVVLFSTNLVYRFNLPTPFDTGASPSLVSSTGAGLSGSEYGLFFSSDGRKMLTSDTSGDINSYNLTTPWDITTKVLIDSFNVSADVSQPRSIFMKPDGTSLYVASQNTDEVYQYSVPCSLQSERDADTMVAEGTFNFASQDTSPESIYIKPDGTKMYMAGDVNNDLFQYTLATPRDITTASYDSVSLAITSPGQVFFSNDGLNFYNYEGGDVRRYTLSTAWDLSTASIVAVQALNPNGVGIYISPDGTRVFASNGGTVIRELSLATPWDVTTLSIVSNESFSIAGNIQDISMRSDGRRLMITNTSGTVHSYALATPWDLSTKTLTGLTSTSNPPGLFVRPNGSRVYTVRAGVGDFVTQYTLS